jgi:hypothetical protein
MPEQMVALPFGYFTASWSSVNSMLKLLLKSWELISNDQYKPLSDVEKLLQLSISNVPPDLVDSEDEGVGTYRKHQILHHLLIQCCNTMTDDYLSKYSCPLFPLFSSAIHECLEGDILIPFILSYQTIFMEGE